SVIPHNRAGAHALLTRAPLPWGRSPTSVRLACVRHAASVRSEPGSNSQVQSQQDPSHVAITVATTQIPSVIGPQTLALLRKRQRPAPPSAHPFLFPQSQSTKPHKD